MRNNNASDAVHLNLYGYLKYLPELYHTSQDHRHSAESWRNKAYGKNDKELLIRNIETKNIMTKSSLPVGGYAVNPYVGCTGMAGKSEYARKLQTGDPGLYQKQVFSSCSFV